MKHLKTGKACKNLNIIRFKQVSVKENVKITVDYFKRKSWIKQHELSFFIYIKIVIK